MIKTVVWFVLNPLCVQSLVVWRSDNPLAVALFVKVSLKGIASKKNPYQQPEG